METEKYSSKKYLAPFAILLMLSLSYASVTYARAFAHNTSQYPARTFSSTGEGKAIVVPDIAQFSFSVITEDGSDLAKLQTDNTTKINTIIAYLKNQKIDPKDIKTAGYNVNPRYEYGTCDRGTCPPPKIVGYSVSQDVSVKARDFTKAGDLLQGVVQNGANSVSGLTFTIDNDEAVKNAARTEAIQKAQEKAENIAQAGHFRIGKIVSIYEDVNPQYNQPVAYGKGAGGVAAPEAAPVPAPAIEPGSTEVTVNVTVTYEIE